MENKENNGIVGNLVAEVTVDKESIESALKEMEKELEELKKNTVSIDKYRETVSNMEELVKDFNGLKKSNETLRAKNEELKKSLEDMTELLKETREELEDENKSLNDEILKLNSELTKLESGGQDQDLIKSLQAEIARLTGVNNSTDFSEFMESEQNRKEFNAFCASLGKKPDDVKENERDAIVLRIIKSRGVK